MPRIKIQERSLAQLLTYRLEAARKRIILLDDPEPQTAAVLPLSSVI